MTLVAGRMQNPHTLERRTYTEEGTVPGILKSGPRKVKSEPNHFIMKSPEPNQRNDDGKRLVRFCESDDQDKYRRSEIEESNPEEQEIIMFGSNMYYINNSDPNSAVRKLFPNSKLTPINPFLSKLQSKDLNIAKSRPSVAKLLENNRNFSNRNHSSSKKVQGNAVKKPIPKIAPKTKPKPGKLNGSSTTLVERIKQLTCDNNDVNEIRYDQGDSKVNYLVGEDYCKTELAKPFILHEPKNKAYFLHPKATDLPKQAKEGLNLMRYNQNILQTRSTQDSKDGALSPTKNFPTEEARRTFLSALSQETKTESRDRTSVATNSTAADTVYSLSDIEEALTEEEKEIKEAFAQEIKQDELELFVQQDAGRTERLRKRYSATPKLENNPAFFLNDNYPTKDSKLNIISNFSHRNCTMKKDKPKFGSTIEILQQLQQQMESPYQMEGRRTACSNYSDSSMNISERLFCDESSDGYEPIHTKFHRTCSLDSKNYEEIENFPSAFCALRTKSQEHPRLTQLESDPYFHCPSTVRYPVNPSARNHSIEKSLYASSPDLHSYQPATIPNRVSSYTNLPDNSRQLHPVLQKQYCRYPLTDNPRTADEGKVLTPPIRMHTYMNVPPTAPCYPSPPPPYSQVNTYNPPPYSYDPHPVHNNIYQNIPIPTNPHMMTMRRLCTERERGVPEGASSSSDSKEFYPTISRDYYYPSNNTTMPKSSSSPHQYCVDV